MIKILPGLKHFRPKRHLEYPPHQGEENLIEEFFFQFIKKNNQYRKSNKIYYIPIFWTNYFIKNNYGKNIRLLKIFIRIFNFFTKKFTKFTIVQYAGGTKVPIDNTIIFSSAGSYLSQIGENSDYVPIPLISKSHKQPNIENKKYKVGFIGRNTHRFREELFKNFSKMEDYKIEIVEKYNNITKFEDVLNNSIFTLCPRGTSPTSFRLYEAIESGSVPIYISDEFWLPFENKINWNEFCIFINPNEINQIPTVVDSLIESSKYKEMAKKGKEVYENFFTMEKISQEIIRIIEDYE